MIKLNGIEVKPTVFPDKTSQVWNVDGISPISNHILWEFKDETEVFQVIQLIGLLNMTYPKSTTLEMPFLPYSRQDKKVSNETTFAGKVFVSLFDSFGIRIVVTDVHNKDLIPTDWINIKPDKQIQNLADRLGITAICYPDYGAASRYNIDKPMVCCKKLRDQRTGEIVEFILTRYGEKLDRVLIVDDICDGGKTFIEAAKLLYKEGAGEVHLYTSHGLYTKGLEPLREAGIKRIFNIKGEV